MLHSGKNYLAPLFKAGYIPAFLHTALRIGITYFITGYYLVLSNKTDNTFFYF